MAVKDSKHASVHSSEDVGGHATARIEELASLILALSITKTLLMLSPGETVGSNAKLHREMQVNQ